MSGHSISVYGRKIASGYYQKIKPQSTTNSDVFIHFAAREHRLARAALPQGHFILVRRVISAHLYSCPAQSGHRVYATRAQAGDLLMFACFRQEWATSYRLRIFSMLIAALRSLRSHAVSGFHGENETAPADIFSALGRDLAVQARTQIACNAYMSGSFDIGFGVIQSPCKPMFFDPPVCQQCPYFFSGVMDCDIGGLAKLFESEALFVFQKFHKLLARF